MPPALWSRSPGVYRGPAFPAPLGSRFPHLLGARPSASLSRVGSELSWKEGTPGSRSGRSRVMVNWFQGRCFWQSLRNSGTSPRAGNAKLFFSSSFLPLSSRSSFGQDCLSLDCNALLFVPSLPIPLFLPGSQSELGKTNGLQSQPGHFSSARLTKS